MRAEVKKLGDVTIISIVGTLEIEETQPFREACKKRLLGEKLVFNLSGANFVGSTGLQSFMEAVKVIDDSGSHGVKMVGAKPEFRRLFASLENSRLQYFEDVRTAVIAFTQTIPLPILGVDPTIVD